MIWGLNRQKNFSLTLSTLSCHTSDLADASGSDNWPVTLLTSCKGYRIAERNNYYPLYGVETLLPPIWFESSKFREKENIHERDSIRASCVILVESMSYRSKSLS